MLKRHFELLEVNWKARLDESPFDRHGAHFAQFACHRTATNRRKQWRKSLGRKEEVKEAKKATNEASHHRPARTAWARACTFLAFVQLGDNIACTTPFVCCKLAIVRLVFSPFSQQSVPQMVLSNDIFV